MWLRVNTDKWVKGTSISSNPLLVLFYLGINKEDIVVFFTSQSTFPWINKIFKNLPIHYTICIGLTEKKPMKRYACMNEIVYEKTVENAGKNQVRHLQNKMGIYFLRFFFEGGGHYNLDINLHICFPLPFWYFLPINGLSLKGL